VTPQVYINWSVIGVPALLGYAEQSVLNASTFLVGFYLLWVGGLAAQIVVMAQVGKLNQRIIQAPVLVGALILIGFGIYQCWGGVVRLLSS
jgi:hypothetical protein